MELIFGKIQYFIRYLRGILSTDQYFETNSWDKQLLSISEPTQGKAQ